MSKDSSHTYIHFRASYHADLFEEFCHPPSSASNPSVGASTAATFANSHTHTHTNGNNATTNTTADQSDPSLAHIPGHFLPFESIILPPHLMPLNPEDEDGVVPDMHAAFGISRAMGAAGMGMGSGGQGEVNGNGVGVGGGHGAAAAFGRGEGMWRDFGLEGLVDGTRNLDVNGSESGNGIGSRSGPVLGASIGSAGGAGGRQGGRREGVRHGVLGLR